MALESYMKDLLGSSSSSEVRIVSDNSTSRLMSAESDEECSNNPHNGRREYYTQSSGMISSHGETRQHDMSILSVTLPEKYDECLQAPTSTNIERDERSDSAELLEESLQRRKSIRGSMSPGVHPRSPRGRVNESPTPRQNASTQPNANDENLRSGKRKLQREDLFFS